MDLKDQMEIYDHYPSKILSSQPMSNGKEEKKEAEDANPEIWEIKQKYSELMNNPNLSILEESKLKVQMRKEIEEILVK